MLELASAPNEHFDEGTFLTAVTRGHRQLQGRFEACLTGL